MNARLLLLAVPSVCIAFGAWVRWSIGFIRADQADLSEQDELTRRPLAASKKDERA